MSEQVEDVIETQDELSALKARADLLGLSYHPSIGVDKLREKVNAAMADPVEETAVVVPMGAAAETVNERRSRKKNEATALVRIRVVCMNPNKKEWDGEIITAGNSTIGTFKKYVPFNADEGWHVPRVIYNQLVERECQVFVSKKDSRGNTVRSGKIIKEFAIEVLPQLTTDELAEMARRQAMAKSID